MKFGDRLEGVITRLDEKGRGVFTYTNQHGTTNDIAVPFTAIGDRIAAIFRKRDKNLRIADLEEVLEPSPDRVKAPCPHAGVCGGCLWQHMSYEAQTRLKQAQIHAALDQYGHSERLSAFHSAPEIFAHRNRMDYVVGWQGTVGLKVYGSWNRYVDVKTCLIMDEASSEILERVRQWMQRNAIAPWDAKHQTGEVRYCVIRRGIRTNERLVTVVVRDASAISTEAREDLLKELAPLTTSLLLGTQSLITDISLAQSFEVLQGTPYLHETVNGVTYRIHPNSFFQTNTLGADILQTRVLEACGFASSTPPASVLDLYCGSGFFGIACAKAGAQVYGCEIDEHAIEQAHQNAQLNHVADRATFEARPSEDLSWLERRADVAIIDPPRSGLHPRVLESLGKLNVSTLVYVSCNYHRLVAELVTLKEYYRVVSIEAVDMFPHTAHVEVICTLVRK